LGGRVRTGKLVAQMHFRPMHLLGKPGRNRAGGLIPQFPRFRRFVNQTIDSMKPASWNLWVDGGFLVLRVAKRGAASWQDGGE
jgi:hypothetical protein